MHRCCAAAGSSPLAQRRAARRLFVGPLAATLLVGQQRPDVRLNIGGPTKDRFTYTIIKPIAVHLWFHML